LCFIHRTLIVTYDALVEERVTAKGTGLLELLVAQPDLETGHKVIPLTLDHRPRETLIHAVWFTVAPITDEPLAAIDVLFLVTPRRDLLASPRLTVGAPLRCGFAVALTRWYRTTLPEQLQAAVVTRVLVFLVTAVGEQAKPLRVIINTVGRRERNTV